MYSGDNIRTFIHYYFEVSFDCGVMSYLHEKQKLLVDTYLLVLRKNTMQNDRKL